MESHAQRSKFHLSFAAFSPTELRLLLIIGNIALLSKPFVTFAGKQHLLFDVGGTIGIAGIGYVRLASTHDTYTVQRRSPDRHPMIAPRWL